MNELKCLICLKTFKYPYLLDRHNNRKKPCKPVEKEKLKKDHQFTSIYINLHQSTSNEQNVDNKKDLKQKIECKYCNKCFTRKSGLTKHLNICIVKKETEALVISQNDKILKMEKEIEELKKKSTTTNNNITNTNTNTNNTINNNIHINNYGEENLNHLRSKDFRDIICSMYNAVPQLIEKIHFDPEHPENQNIKYTNKKFPYLNLLNI